MIIGKTTPVPEEAPGVAQRFQRRDISQSLRNSESGMVDQVLVTTNPDGQKFVKLRVSSSSGASSVLMRSMMVSPAPHKGSKIASRLLKCLVAADVQPAASQAHAYNMRPRLKHPSRSPLVCPPGALHPDPPGG